MAQDPTKRPPLERTNKSHPNLEEEIRRSAYELYEQPGAKMGTLLMTGITPKLKSTIEP